MRIKNQSNFFVHISKMMGERALRGGLAEQSTQEDGYKFLVSHHMSNFGP